MVRTSFPTCDDSSLVNVDRANCRTVGVGRRAVVRCRFPFFLLGGVLVPVRYLPGWIQPASKAVFLSWSAGLLRATLSPTTLHGVTTSLLAIALLGLAGYATGTLLIDRILRRVRVTGTLAQM
jgi:ABC-2 type transport system permease protein